MNNLSVWLSIIALAVSLGTYAQSRAMRNRWAVLDYLKENPGWHYGTDLVRRGVCSYGAVYAALGWLEESGFVVSQLEDQTAQSVRRPIYRASVPNRQAKHGP